MNLEFTPQPEKKKVVRKKNAPELMPQPAPVSDASTQEARAPRKRTRIKAGTLEWKTAVENRKKKQDARTKPASIIEKPKRIKRILAETNPDSTTPIEFKEDFDHTVDAPENLPVEHLTEMPVDLDEMTLKDIIKKEDASYQDITQELHHLEEQGTIELVSQESPWDHFEDIEQVPVENQPPVVHPPYQEPAELLQHPAPGMYEEYEDAAREQAWETKQIHDHRGKPQELYAHTNLNYLTSETEKISRDIKNYSPSKRERNNRGILAAMKRKLQDWFMADGEEFDED